MRLTHWLLGIVLGAFAGGFALEAGFLALLLVMPGLAWAAREQTRPVGLAGLLVGAGAGVGGLFALADARCAAFNSAADGIVQSCSSPDATPYLGVALLLVVVGALLTMVGLRRTNSAD